MATILLVDDEPSILKILQTYLRKADHETIPAGSAEEALQLFDGHDFDLMIVDLRLGEGMDGLELMHELRALDPALPVIMITAYGTIEVAVQAMKEGAVDFITKPFEFKKLSSVISKALQVGKYTCGNTGEEVEEPPVHFDSLVGESEEMQRIYRIIEKVGPTNATVLIQGESGTGKELVAKAIQNVSNRNENAWVPLNCAAIPHNLLESELFGHAAGAFTGANQDRPGIFSEANGGTIFLDEIGVLDYGLQGKLLRVLQEGQLRPIGQNKDIPVNVRVIAATNDDLEEKKDVGEFREDLFYRLSVIPMEIPPLRHRRSDIPLVARYFARREASELGRDISFEEGVMETLCAYGWPGNIRELQNAIACAATLSETGVLRVEDFPPYIQGESKIMAEGDADYRATIQQGTSLRDFLHEKEHAYMEAVLEHTGGNRAKAADLLGISRATFYRKFPEAATE
ncbi:MAG: sigma-54 dependent transcriptional regulator [Lentisphaeria bacterium]